VTLGENTVGLHVSLFYNWKVNYYYYYYYFDKNFPTQYLKWLMKMMVQDDDDIGDAL
jgi:hypothetical protein